MLRRIRIKCRVNACFFFFNFVRQLIFPLNTLFFFNLTKLNVRGLFVRQPKNVPKPVMMLIYERLSWNRTELIYNRKKGKKILYGQRDVYNFMPQFQDMFCSSDNMFTY